MRASPYIAHPSFSISESINMVKDQRIRMFVDRKSPMTFLVHPLESNHKFKVSIGSSQICSCGETEICIHIIYILMKVFSVPAENDILWQNSLTDREVENIINGNHLNKIVKKPQTIYRTKSGKQKVKRLKITSEDLCCICYDEMHEETEQISWCRTGCGGNFHYNCVQEWIKSTPHEATCPICRSTLNVLGLNCSTKKVKRVQPASSSNERLELTQMEIAPNTTHFLSLSDDNVVSNRLDRTRLIRVHRQSPRIPSESRLRPEDNLVFPNSNFRVVSALPTVNPSPYRRIPFRPPQIHIPKQKTHKNDPDLCQMTIFHF